MIGGVDEAGRGPLVGPMVIAVVVGDGEELRRLGVRDSKTLSPQRRRALYYKILDVADCVNYVVIEPQIIDMYVAKEMLNVLELDYTAKLLKTCPADLYYVDSPDVNAERYGAALAFMTGARIVAMHRGESVAQVAAASIVAKVVRDSLLDLLKREVGDFGSGYPSDPRTRQWVKAGRIPEECIRKTWKVRLD
ncbi:MAG: ribonuclease HII [Pyrobaculum sp.]